MRRRPRSVAATSSWPDRAVDEVVAGVEEAAAGGGVAEAAVEVGGNGHRVFSFAQPAHAGGGGLPGRFRARVERGRDLVVGEVVAVAEHDGRALLRRQAVGELAEILVGGPRVLVGELGQLAVGRVRRWTSIATREAIVSTQARRCSPCSRRSYAAERAQERLLEGVLGAVAAEPPAQETEHLGAVLDVERLERRDRHGAHHP